MDSSDLPAEKLEALLAQLGPHLAYLAKLDERLRHLDFPPDDELRAAAQKAHDAVQALVVIVNYLACVDDAGRKPRAR